MADVRIHRGDPARFVKVPNALARDPALPPAARGYLVEVLSRPPGWTPETVEDAAARVGLPVEAMRAVFRQLEHAGYRHRVRRRGPGGRVISEAHYYDQATAPCPDERTCITCGETPGQPGPGDTRTRYDLRKRGERGRWE
jgi:hypothetical protein